MMKVPAFCGNWCFGFFFFCRDVCRDEGNGRANTRFGVFFFCSVFLSFSPLFSPPLPLLCSPFYRDGVACPKTSPAFAGPSDLLQIFSSPVESGWRRQARLFHPATVPFRQKWIFSFWPLIFGNLTNGSQVIKNFF
jgi:hypothetical protein